jgi:protease-4
MAASAALWVGSQCREVLVESAASSQLGSIGVIATHVDASAAYAKEGYKITLIRSDGSPQKALFNGIEPLTEELMAATIEEMRPIKDAFVAAVKKGRPAATSEDIYDGRIFNGKQAVANGLADRIGYMGDAVRRADLLSRQ